MSAATGAVNPRKPDVSMTADERAVFLAGTTELVLARIGDDGFPTGAVVGCSFADGVLCLATTLPAGTPVCAIAERAPDYRGIKGVMVHGVLEADGRLPVGTDVASFDFAKAI
jgi:hypothetical protein